MMNSIHGEPHCLAQIDFRESTERILIRHVEFVCHNHGEMPGDVWEWIREVAERGRISVKE